MMLYMMGTDTRKKQSQSFTLQRPCRLNRTLCTMDTDPMYFVEGKRIYEKSDRPGVYQLVTNNVYDRVTNNRHIDTLSKATPAETFGLARLQARQ